MNKLRIAAAATALLPVLMGASECNVGGKPAQTPDCQVSERAQNSNGIWYVRITCDSQDPGVAETLSGPEQWPACVPTAYWPECKEAK